MTHPDAKLSAYLDELDRLHGRRAGTGRLPRNRLDRPRPHRKPERRSCCRPTKTKWLEESNSHELYNLGHMYEAAAAHYEATGKSNFLDVATKSADLLVKHVRPRTRWKCRPGIPKWSWDW